MAEQFGKATYIRIEDGCEEFEFTQDYVGVTLLCSLLTRQSLLLMSVQVTMYMQCFTTIASRWFVAHLIRSGHFHVNGLFLNKRELDFERGMGENPHGVRAVDALSCLLGFEGESTRVWNHCSSMSLAYFQTWSRASLSASVWISDWTTRTCTTTATPSVGHRQSCLYNADL